MTSFGCKKMRAVVEQILKGRGQFEEFQKGEDFHLIIENQPFMPLVIEKHGQSISVTHYLETNGDLIPDPDLELIIGADGEWYPVALQFCTGLYRRARFWKDGKEFVNPKEMADQRYFSNIWARNLRDQGFITAGL
jgi:hypothetical protein